MRKFLTGEHLNLVEKNAVLEFSSVERNSRKNIYLLVSRELKNTLGKLSRLEVSLIRMYSNVQLSVRPKP